MKVLIVFETVEGQTRKIAQWTADQVGKSGHEVVVFDTAEKTGPVSFDGIDKVILAASVHERRHPKNFETFIAAHLGELDARDTLLMSVSLAAAFPEGAEEARDFLIEMEMRTKFTPTKEALVAGAVRTSSYDYFSAMVMRLVVLRERNYNLSDGEREFTDWAALEKTLSEFLASSL